jgi:predicted DNA-binding transcriptional regulator AlpA
VALTGLSKTTLYVRIRAGEFPRPVQVSSQAVGFLESEVLAWQAARIAERDQPHQRGGWRRGQRVVVKAKLTEAAE